MTSKVFLALRVPADPTWTFEVFTQEIALWWGCVGGSRGNRCSLKKTRANSPIIG